MNAWLCADHIARMIELLGPLPRSMIAEPTAGKYAREYFNRHGELRHLPNLETKSMQHVLRTKYKWSRAEADMFASFLLPMLRFVPSERATAAQALQHPWMKESEAIANGMVFTMQGLLEEREETGGNK